jgi:hypothetical protein
MRVEQHQFGSSHGDSLVAFPDIPKLLPAGNKLIALTATEAPKVLKYLSSNRAALFREENLSSGWIARRSLDADQSEPGASVSRLFANALHIAAHNVTIEIQIARIRAHRLAFFKGDRETRYCVREWN